MRILIHSNAPWCPTGYGLQTRLLMEQLRQRGHTVAVSAFAGLGGADVRWKGHLVMPSGQMAFGLDMLIPHMQRFGADLTITLMDTWKLESLGDALRAYPVLAWMPVDCAPVGRRDVETIKRSGAVPVAMSVFGRTQLSYVLDAIPEYAPHAVDTVEMAPMEDRRTYREELGVDDKFVIGICAANKDTTRKAFAEQFAAFARHNARHKDSVLLVHSAERSVSGLDLMELAVEMEILRDIRFTNQYVVDSGLMDATMMRHWFSACDVLSLCSYGEGFGIPLIEAQACGTPVITTAASAMAELRGPGWLVEGDRFWNPVHHAWWSRPSIEAIAKAYNAAYNESIPSMQSRRERAREFALEYDVTRVFETHWEPILKELTV